MHKPVRKKTILVIVCLSILAGVFIAGLWPFNFFQKNNVQWLADSRGITIGHYGLLYSNYTIDANLFKRGAITIEMALRITDETTHSLQQIITFYNPDKKYDELIIGQWISHCIVERSDDSIRQKKIGDRYTLPVDSVVFLTIVSDTNSTALFLNGKHRQAYNGFHILPAGNLAGTKILVGAAPSGNSQWRGNVHALAMYTRKLNKEEVAANYDSWRRQDSLSVGEDQCMLYNFKQSTGRMIPNAASPDEALCMPARFPIFNRTVLEAPWNKFRFNRSTYLDIFLNILGFVPLGFFFAIAVAEIRRSNPLQIYGITIMVGFVVSLAIEVLQGFLPSRSSSFMDFILNTAGTFIGVGLLHFSFLFEGPERLKR